MKYHLEIITFVAGVEVMVLELVGSRLVAPYLGTSIYVWTSLIGIILLALSIGYYLGGRLADKNPSHELLSRVLLFAAIFSSCILIVEQFLLLVVQLPLSLRAITVVVSLFLFAPATVTLGMISPIVARLKLETLTNAGKDIGTLYALSTLGSIIGTFLGGFILISYWGTKTIFIALSFILFCLYVFSLLSHKKPKISYLLIGIFIVTFFTQIFSTTLSQEYLADIDTPYNRWLVYDQKDPRSSRSIRYLINNIFGVQSAMAIDKPDELVFPYLTAFAQATELRPNFSKALLIGAGAYSFPKYFVSTYPEKTLDIVEIDPNLQTISKDYFSFKTSPQLQIYDADGRIFLNTTSEKYDLIFLDAFSSRVSIPFHLTTQEAITKINNALAPNGLVVVNIISPLSGNKSEFLTRELATYKSVFTFVSYSQIDPTASSDEIQNIILYASQSPFPGEHMIRNDFPRSLILTDDFAPIEKFIETMFEDTYTESIKKL